MDTPDGSLPTVAIAPVLAEARRQWPGLKVDDRVFAGFLWARRPEQAEPATLDWLAELETKDLYLVCAALAGDARALGLLEELAGPLAREVADRNAWCGVTGMELRSHLLASLLVAEAGREPRLSQYSGRGPLAGFLRVCAVRLAINSAAGQSRHVALDDTDLAERAVRAEGDEELSRIKQIYRPAFEAAMREALQALPARERNLLKLHHVERLPCERIARLYGVHTSTLWRWLDRTYRDLRQDILRRLAGRLGADVGDAESILRLVSSQLDDSLRQVL